MVKKRATRPQQNPVAVALAKRRPKAGTHKDRKKEASKKACRGRIRRYAADDAGCVSWFGTRP